MHPFIEHLVDDHRKQRALGARLAETESPGDRKRLREQMEEELLPHMAGEEDSIFSYMRASGDDAKDHALEAMQEHHVARIVLRELLDLGLDSEVFGPKATVLLELNRHHMEEEEGKHFPWLEKHASGAVLDKLFADYKATERAAEKSLAASA